MALQKLVYCDLLSGCWWCWNVGILPAYLLDCQLFLSMYWWHFELDYSSTSMLFCIITVNFRSSRPGFSFENLNSNIINIIILFCRVSALGILYLTLPMHNIVSLYLVSTNVYNAQFVYSNIFNIIFCIRWPIIQFYVNNKPVLFFLKNYL